MLNDHIWLVPIILDSADIKHFHPLQKVLLVLYYISSRHIFFTHVLNYCTDNSNINHNSLYFCSTWTISYMWLLQWPCDISIITAPVLQISKLMHRDVKSLSIKDHTPTKKKSWLGIQNAWLWRLYSHYARWFKLTSSWSISPGLGLSS